MNISIVVPMFNEAENVPRIRAELQPEVDELTRLHEVDVVLVDDGSTDGTFDELARAFSSTGGPQLRFEIVRHRTNQGLGAALRTGFASCAGDVIVTVDSDGSYEFSEISALLFCLDPDVDLVTASPYHPNGNVEGIPAFRLLLSRGCSLGYRLLLDRQIHTYTCMFRAYRRSVIDNVEFESDGYLAVTELMVKAMLHGYRAVEYPAVLRKRSLGTSKANIARTIRDHLRFQASVFLKRSNPESLIGEPEGNRAST